MIDKVALVRAIATLGPIGYLSAPGTMASVVTLPLVFLLQTLAPTDFSYALLVTIIFFFGIGVINYIFCQTHHTDDPREIVIDELVGCLITFWMIPFAAKSMLIGFVLFRLFDIAKIGGVHFFERLPGAWGVMLDDVAAGLWANLLLRLIIITLY